MRGHNKDKKKIFIMLVTAIAFFVVTMPFRRFFGLTGLTEVRPAAALPVVFGILFGVPGALGCAIGNLFADVCSGYSFEVCTLGLAAQFLYGYLPYKMWHGRRKTQEKEVRLDSVRNVLRYIGIVFVNALFMAIALGAILQHLALGKLWSESTLILFFNNLVFSLILGIPILIVAGAIKEQEKGKVLTLNVRFVLIFLLLSVLSAGLMGIVSYKILKYLLEDAVKLWDLVYQFVSLDFFLLCGLSIGFLWYLERNITVPVEELTGIARNYMTKESADKEIQKTLQKQCDSLSRFHGEPGELASAFGKMMKDVEHYVKEVTTVTAEKERIRSELTVAARLQADMLPDSAAELTERCEFDLCAKMTPAKEVGGDFYDFFLVDNDRIALVMADVSGKGVPAALFMVVARTLIRNCIATETPLEKAVENVNNSLCANNKNGMFVTAWIGILSLSTGVLKFVNAGHNAPLLARKDEKYEYIRERSGFVLAGMEKVSYRQLEMVLKAGDMLFLYTDGVTEAHDCHKNMYEEERLKLCLNHLQKKSPQETVDGVWRDILVFRGKAEQFDDITMISFCYMGSEKERYKLNVGEPVQKRMGEINKFVENTLITSGFPGRFRSSMLLVTDEIFTNICSYSDAREVTVGCLADEKEAALYFEDDGVPYNPLKRDDPNIHESIERRVPGGLGIYLVKELMDEVEYVYRNGKNCLTIHKGVDK